MQSNPEPTPSGEKESSLPTSSEEQRKSDEIFDRHFEEGLRRVGEHIEEATRRGIPVHEYLAELDEKKRKEREASGWQPSDGY